MKRPELIWVLAALAGAGVYLAVSAARGQIGFALDDAWIHQVYARNLGEHGELSFFTGQISAGSTSPLWSSILAVGYALHLDFHFWTYLWGALALGGSAVLSSRLIARWQAQTSFGTSPWLPVVVPLFLVLEWHMAWSAVSGMEIPLFVFLSLALLSCSISIRPPRTDEGRTGVRWFWAAGLVGLLAGLLTLTRPEGVVFAGLVIVGRLMQSRGPSWTRGDSLGLVGMGLGFSLVVLPDLLFNYAASGTLLPNTFYAKSAEYAILFQQAPFVVRWLRLLGVPWIGPQVLLLPGLLAIAVLLGRRGEWSLLAPLAWVLALPALYAARLPVDYQHGRYLMPAVPYIVLFGLWGTGLILQRLRNWTLRTTWVASIGAVLIAFWLLGANAYSTDVAIIDCEMVGTSQWVSANVPSGALIAVHDIGAMEYYDPRPFIDLAGLVSPEVIPFIRDQGRLREFLISRGAGFAVFFPDWYPAWSSDPTFVLVHQTNCSVTREAGSTNLAVYRIEK